MAGVWVMVGSRCTMCDNPPEWTGCGRHAVNGVGGRRFAARRHFEIKVLQQRADEDKEVAAGERLTETASFSHAEGDEHVKRLHLTVDDKPFRPEGVRILPHTLGALEDAMEGRDYHCVLNKCVKCIKRHE